MEEKGVTDAINAIKIINNKYGKQIATLDIYGPIEPEYKNKLLSLIDSTNDSCKYCGVIDSNKSVEA